MTTIKTADLKVDAVFKGDLTLDQKIIVAPANTKVPQYVIKRLGEWNIS